MHKFKIRYLLLTVVCTSLISYFAYHMISGDRGILAFIKLNSQIYTLQNELDVVRGERLALERRANLLKSDSLDLDLLEEQAKKILGYAKPQESILIEEIELTQ